METLAQLADKWHLTADVAAVTLLLASRCDNHLWRWICFGICAAIHQFGLPLLAIAIPSPHWLVYPALAYAFVKVPSTRFGQKTMGAIFVTGADSGMGQNTVVYLAKHASYDIIFAGAFDKVTAEENFEKLCVAAGTSNKNIVVVSLDVSKDESVEAAKRTAEKAIESHGSCVGLTSMICFHGIGSNGPIEYMPISMFQRTYEVNYIGNVRMTQAFLPMMRKTLANPKCLIRGRMIFTGTGGGPCSPCPSLLSAYMSSKFAGEAFVQSLRMELSMTRVPIDCAVINPGFVKPTMLIAEGQKLTERMWKACEERFGDNRAKAEFGAMMDHFNLYAAKIPGTHVSKVAEAALHALTAYRPRSSYKVGIDSKLAPIVGMLPTGVREFISRNGMYGFLSPAGTVKNYEV